MNAGKYIVLVLALSGALNVSAERVYYLYENADGILVQSDRLPPEAVPRGYKVVNASGDIVKEVARQLTAEEKVAFDAEMERRRAQQQELERIRKWDETLLLRYSTVDEIDEAQARSLREYDVRISILSGNLMSLKTQIEAEQGEAANYERAGREVPEALHKRISDLKAEVDYAETATTELKQERIDAEMQFEKDKERFDYLMERVGLRKEMQQRGR